MLERWKKQLFFRGRDESSQCFVYSFVSGQKSPFTICAYTVWFVYLVYSVRHTKSKGMKIFYSCIKYACNSNRTAQCLFYHLVARSYEKRNKRTGEKTNA